MLAMRLITSICFCIGSPTRISDALWCARWQMISAIVCGCSSWMNVSRFSLSARCRNANGVFCTCVWICAITRSATFGSSESRSSRLA
jgi:hypothetical protein